MSIYISNSLTKRKEEFIPLKRKRVKMYVCGVTVYDDCHIGHARSLYIFNVINNYLKYRGYRVKFVRNITDIDDKIINKAKELGVSSQEVAKRFTESYQEDLKLLRIDTAGQEPKATENIKAMIRYISGLIDKGYAYQSAGDVYFRVRKFNDYGKLSGQSLDQMIAGTRKEPGENKKDPLDFALWKKSKQGEPSWDSSWGKGRPGWHIECSTMSMKYLDTQTLDIHAGGRDLIFPHHENEIAQAEALTGKQFAKYWIHHGLLTINGQKMAKSLGNFVTVKDLVKKYNNPDILKIFFLCNHYASPADFTWEKMEEAKTAYEHIDILIGKLDDFFREHPLKKLIRLRGEPIKEFKDKFIESMDDDFNTPRALSVLFDMIKECNKLLESDDEFKNFKLRYAAEIIKEMADVFSLDLQKRKKAREGLACGVRELIAERNKAREAGDFAKADSMRKELEAKGIILEDTKEGTKWRQKL